MRATARKRNVVALLATLKNGKVLQARGYQPLRTQSAPLSLISHCCSKSFVESAHDGFDVDRLGDSSRSLSDVIRTNACAGAEAGHLNRNPDAEPDLPTGRLTAVSPTPDAASPQIHDSPRKRRERNSYDHWPVTQGDHMLPIHSLARRAGSHRAILRTADAIWLWIDVRLLLCQ